MKAKAKTILIAQSINGDLVNAITTLYQFGDGFSLKDADGVFKNSFVVILMANMEYVVVKKIFGNGSGVIDKIPAKVFFKHFKPIN